MARRAQTVAPLVRPATPHDRPAVTALVRQTTAQGPYSDAVAYYLRRAFDVGDEEARVLVSDVESAIVGAAIYGRVAGAIGIGRLHFVGVSGEVRRVGIGSSLCHAAIAKLVSAEARSVIVEMPDDSDFRPGHSLLERCGLSIVARVSDYYRDGVDLLVLERRLLP
jgi:ribosomal protein S18 acetylase RimI-like enzyme